MTNDTALPVELMPCPHCGAEPYPHVQNSSSHVEGDPSRWLQIVWCHDCGAVGPHRNTEAEAIAAWNTRALSATRTAVKPLEWVGDEAVTPFGKYRVTRTDDGYALTFEFEELVHIGFNAVEPFQSPRVEAMDRAQPDYERLILSALVEPAPTHRHKKRGSEYVLIGIGKMQAESWVDMFEGGVLPVDMTEVAIYRDVKDGSLWARPREEFEDGRFEALSTTEGE